MYLQMVIKSPSCLASLSSACDLTEIFILPGSQIALLTPSLQMVGSFGSDAPALLTPGSWRCDTFAAVVVALTSGHFTASSYEVLPQICVSITVFPVCLQ